MKREGMERRLSSILRRFAPASGMFYRGALFPEFKNNFFSARLKAKRLLDWRWTAGASSLRKSCSLKLTDAFGKLRKQPDGSIYFSTSNRDGRGARANRRPHFANRAGGG
jgi:glucose/arabinose dehydrogenase